MPSEVVNGQQTDTSETFETLLEISNLLNTGLDSEELLMCIKLIQSGIDPMGLAMVVQTAKQKAKLDRQSGFLTNL